MNEWEQQEELAPIVPASSVVPEPHEFDLLPPEVIAIFHDIVKYRVDPAGDYYKMDLDTIVSKIRALDTQAVHAIDSEYRYERKGYMYDPILESFVRGCGGQITTWNKTETSLIPIVLRGITKRKEMNMCRARGKDFYYIDTGYFGNGKKKLYHRITKNDVQNFGPVIERPNDRFARTGISPAKVRANGSKILLAPPSQKLLNLYEIDLETWLVQTMHDIRQHSDREVVIRRKQGRSVRVNHDTIEMALDQDIYCLITYSSIAAGEAILHGKPAITLGPNAAASLCSTAISEIEKIKTPSLDEIHAWCRHIAYCQFTEAEMRDGTAWSILQS